MNIRSIRNFVLEKVAEAAPSDVVVYADGDVSKPDAGTTRARVKVLPRETEKPGLGLNGYREGAGLVQIDLFGAKVNGRDILEDFAEEIVNSIPFATHSLEDGKTLHVWSVWVDQFIDDPVYFHIPVFIRWTLLHN